MKKQINVLIADDHPIFGEAEDGESALACIRKLQPDVAVLDMDMPPPDGLAVAVKLREEGLPVEVIFLTMHNEEELLNAALNAGVKSFIVKDGAANELTACIKAVAAVKTHS